MFADNELENSACSDNGGRWVSGKASRLNPSMGKAAQITTSGGPERLHPVPGDHVLADDPEIRGRCLAFPDHDFPSTVLGLDSSLIAEPGEPAGSPTTDG